MDDKIRTIDLGMVNAYLLKAGDGFVLVDSGMPMHWQSLDGQLAAAGCVPGKLKLLIITHGDIDHIGSVPKLREKYNVKVAMNAGDVPQVEKGVMLKRKVKPLIYKVMMLYRLTMMKLKKTRVNFPKFKPDVLLADGQSLAEYGLAAKIIHLPGHTPGSIGVLTDDGDLFAGDTFTNRKMPAEANIIENSKQLKNSLAKLKTLNIKTVYPGHGTPFAWDKISGKLH
jgi:hydroxyacylglutathione hydrolase